MHPFKVCCIRMAAGLGGLFVVVTADAQIRFNDVTTSAIGNFRSETWGSAVGDFNGDGWPDIYVSNHRVRPFLYRNSGNGTFTNSILTLAGDEFMVRNRYLDQHGGAWSDIDNDGDDDLMMQGNGDGIATPSGLLISNGRDALNNRFKAWGLPTFGGRGIGWVDYDLDGDLDLFRSNLGRGSIPLIYKRSAKQRFAGNLKVRGCGGTNSILVTDFDGNRRPDLVCVSEGRFPREIYALGSRNLRSITRQTNVPIVANVADVASADFDNDRDPDLVFATGTLQKNQALPATSRRIEALLDASRSQGEAGFKFTGGGILNVTVYAAQPTYVERRGKRGIKTTRKRRAKFRLNPADPKVQGVARSRSGNALFFGYNASAKRWTVTLSATASYRAYYVTVETSQPYSKLRTTGLRNVDGPLRPEYLRNEGGGTYTKQNGYSNLPLVECAGVAAGDFDNDMDVDLYFICQRGGENIRNRLFANNGSGRFFEVAGAGGARGAVGSGFYGSNGWGDNASVADFNNDGYLDLFVTNGINVYPTRNRSGHHQMFYNAGGNRSWIKFDLKGTTSDPTALGARVTVTAGGVTQIREQNGGYHRWTQNHQRLHFGLAGNNQATVRVRWPDGTTQNFGSLKARTTWRLKQRGRAKVVPLGTAKAFRATQRGDECGTPRIAKDLDRALFVYKNCTNGRWRIRAVGGGDSKGTAFIGSVTSDVNLKDVKSANLESSDRASGRKNLTFRFSTRNTDSDEVRFTIPKRAREVCFRLATPRNVPVMLGRKYRRIDSGINLVTMRPCVQRAEFKITNVTVNENVGIAKLTVSLSRAVDASIKVFTRAGTATGGRDYVGFSRTLSFSGGNRSKTIRLPIVNDRRAEPREQLTVRLTDAKGAGISDGIGQVTIRDDD